ncbi:MAG: hypothetical protein WCA77_04140, partial [Thermoplasmata archaeon]
IMVVEMAGSYTVLPAAMLSIFIAYVVTGRTHIYSEQLPSRIQSPAHLEEYRTYFLSETPIADIAIHESEPVAPQLSVREALDIAITHGRAILSVQSEGEWFGAVRLRDLLDVDFGARDSTLVIELARPVELLLSSDLSAAAALALMEARGTKEAVVVASTDPIRVIGVVTRRGIRAPDPNTTNGTATTNFL